jgi:hypothetical protein
MSNETKIRPFQVDTPDDAIADLRRRIAETRWPHQELRIVLMAQECYPWPYRPLGICKHASHDYFELATLPGSRGHRRGRDGVGNRPGCPGLAARERVGLLPRRPAAPGTDQARPSIDRDDKGPPTDVSAGRRPSDSGAAYRNRTDDLFMTRPVCPVSPLRKANDRAHHPARQQHRRPAQAWLADPGSLATCSTSGWCCSL